MNKIVVDFLSKECKNKRHSNCHGQWMGLGLDVVCECHCHKKNDIADGFEGPQSATSGHHLLEVTNRSD